MSPRDDMTGFLPFAGFRFQHSNSLERLADRVADEVIGLQRRAPLVPVSITIPHAGVGIWLKQQLADRLGAAANLQFQQPTELVWDLARRALGAESVDRARALDADALTLALHHTFDPVLEAEPQAMAPVRRYLERSAADPDKARFGLARELAGLLRDLMIYRPQWIDAWSHGRSADPARGAVDERWQRALWQQAWATAAGDAVGDNPGALLGELLAGPAVPGPPLLLFGISHLPPVFVDVLAWAATCRQVHLYMPSPCREYWADEPGERRRLREAVQAAGQLLPHELTPRELVPNDLLASLGRMGQEFLQRVCDGLEDQLPETDAAGYREPATYTRLGWLQRALLDLDAPVVAPQPDDGSIQLHACHSRLREVEVLHDQILAWLDTDGAHAARGYTARDILVVAPDIDAYAPFVRAVFGAEIQRRGAVPFNISDRKPIDAHPIVQAFLEILDLPTADFEAEAVVALLETPAIARRLGVSEEELGRIRHWAAELHVHWGVDGTHRGERSAGELPEVNSWRHGLDRLLLGLASMQDETVLRVGGAAILPWPEVEGSAAEAAGKLAHWVGRLDRLRRRLRADRTAEAWQTFLNDHVVDALFAPSFDDREESAAEASLRDAFDALASAARRAGTGEQLLSWSAVREWLHARLGEALAQRRFLSRGVTFANTVPLRAVPARVVCMLGMNAGEFPRAAKPRAFDLLDRNRRAGDRSARDEDRYLFLETLLAASDALYLSWLGRDQQENNVRDPSPLVSELRGFFDRAVPGAGPDDPVLAVTEHPLQPFSPGNFDTASTGRVQSHQDRWIPAAIATRTGVDEGPRSRFFEPSEDLPPLPPASTWPEVVTLDQLEGFFRSPARYFLSRELELRLEDREANLPAAHVVDALLKYKVGEEVNRRAIEGDGRRPEGWPDEVERLRGWMPGGRLEARLVEGGYEEELVALVREQVAGVAEREAAIDLPVTLPGGDRSIRVRGKVGDLHGDRLVRWTRSRMHGRRWVPIVVAAAALARAGEPIRVAVFEKRSKGYGEATLPGSLAPAVRPNLLEDLLALYLRGQHEPLAFFPESAWEWMRRAAKPADAATAAVKKFFPGSGGPGGGPPSESEKCAWSRTLTRDWDVDDLLCGQFRRAAERVFGGGGEP